MKFPENSLQIQTNTELPIFQIITQGKPMYTEKKNFKYRRGPSTPLLLDNGSFILYIEGYIFMLRQKININININILIKQSSDTAVV